MKVIPVGYKGKNDGVEDMSVQSFDSVQDKWHIYKLAPSTSNLHRSPYSFYFQHDHEVIEG